MNLGKIENLIQLLCLACFLCIALGSDLWEMFIILGIILCFAAIALYFCKYKCPHCGYRLKKFGLSFCPSCGRKLDSESRSQLSLEIQLEVIKGGYSLFGECYSKYGVETLYYDYHAKKDASSGCAKAEIGAYLFKDESIAIVNERMLPILKEDAKGYNIKYITVSDLKEKELNRDDIKVLDDMLDIITWIDDDFLNDENIEFDYDAFERIDSGIKYLNPKHFSAAELVDVLRAESHRF